MDILSPVHGKINYTEDEIIKFNKAIPGFEHIERYILKDIEDSPFKLLHAIDDLNIGFIAISPFEVEKEYEIKLSDELINRLEIEKASDVLLYSLVTLNSEIKNITANLKAPIVINIKNKIAEQYIFDEDKYKIKHPLMKGW